MFNTLSQNTKPSEIPLKVIQMPVPRRCSQSPEGRDLPLSLYHKYDLKGSTLENLRNTYLDSSLSITLSYECIQIFQN